MTIAEIQALYPHPVPCTDDVTDEQYCVGGALCLYQWEVVSRQLHYPSDGFPSQNRIAANLALLNKHLPLHLQHAYANSIMVDNDAGRIERAWQTAAEALAYHPEAP